MKLVYVIAKSLDELAEMITPYMKGKYEPVGGVTINETYQGKEFIQTVVKRIEPENPTFIETIWSCLKWK